MNCGQMGEEGRGEVSGLGGGVGGEATQGWEGERGGGGGVEEIKKERIE